MYLSINKYTIKNKLPENFLDESDEGIQYINTYGNIAKLDGDIYYYHLTKDDINELSLATTELYGLFKKATDYVFSMDINMISTLWNIPEYMLDKIKFEYNKSSKEILIGRFDICVNNNIKVYEFNCDSCGYIMECGKIQHEYAEQIGLYKSYDNITPHIIDAIKNKNIKGILHLLYDVDCHSKAEEYYTTLYFKSIVEKAGIECKILHGLNDIYWSKTDYYILDNDGNIIVNLWKTFSWTTAFNKLKQIPDENRKWYSALTHGDRSDLKPYNTIKPELIDLLFDPRINVIEPIWVSIMGSKSILPIYGNYIHIINIY